MKVLKLCWQTFLVSRVPGAFVRSLSFFIPFVFTLDDRQLSFRDSLFYFFGFFCFLASIYCLNSFLNFDDDLKNPRFKLQSLYSSRFFMGLFIFFCIFSGFVFSFLSNTLLFIWACLSLFFWYVYSSSRWRLKLRPIIGGLLHWAAQFFLQLVAWQIWYPLSFNMIVFSSIFSLFSTAGYFRGLVTDYDSDQDVLGRVRLSLSSVQLLARSVFLLSYLLLCFWLNYLGMDSILTVFYFMFFLHVTVYVVFHRIRLVQRKNRFIQLAYLLIFALGFLYLGITEMINLDYMDSGLKKVSVTIQGD
ncbi:hypothetical protein HOG98_08805 [bacterium]|jgi:4-hydroxybenzoate polyprenyltransferase|nr:hypothetical protein [bacterium]